VSDEITASAKEASSAPNLPVSTTIDPETPPTIPDIGATELMVAGSSTQDQAKEHLAAPELDLQSVDRAGTPPPSPQADVVAQLEAWLRAIESRRHDRDTTNQSSPKIS